MLQRKKVDKFMMNLDLMDGGISSVLYHRGHREKAFMSILSRNIKKGDVCIDLGSNIGYTTLFMLDSAGPKGVVYAIEPDIHNIQILKLNIEENNFSETTIIDQCAISDSDGVIDFWIADKPNLNSVKKTKHSIRKEEVSCCTLTSYLQDKKYPNFIKMDVEGHEVKIFEGALDYFTKNKGRTNFLVEVHPHFYDKENDFAKILREYAKIGFKCKALVTTPIPQPSLLRESGYKPSEIFHTDGFMRGVYYDVDTEDMIEFSCNEHHEAGSKKIVRSFMFGRD